CVCGATRCCAVGRPRARATGRRSRHRPTPGGIFAPTEPMRDSDGGPIRQRLRAVAAGGNRRFAARRPVRLHVREPEAVAAAARCGVAAAGAADPVLQQRGGAVHLHALLITAGSTASVSGTPETPWRSPAPCTPSRRR